MACLHFVDGLHGGLVGFAVLQNLKNAEALYELDHGLCSLIAGVVAECDGFHIAYVVTRCKDTNYFTHGEYLTRVKQK